jgi:hypothetical protein
MSYNKISDGTKIIQRGRRTYEVKKDGNDYTVLECLVSLGCEGTSGVRAGEIKSKITERGLIVDLVREYEKLARKRI